MEGYYLTFIFISPMSILFPVDIKFLKHDFLCNCLCNKKFLGLFNDHAKTHPLFDSDTPCWQEILRCETAILILLYFPTLYSVNSCSRS